MNKHNLKPGQIFTLTVFNSKELIDGTYGFEVVSISKSGKMIELRNENGSGRSFYRSFNVVNRWIDTYLAQ